MDVIGTVGFTSLDADLDVGQQPPSRHHPTPDQDRQRHLQPSHKGRLPVPVGQLPCPAGAEQQRVGDPDTHQRQLELQQPVARERGGVGSEQAETGGQLEQQPGDADRRQAALGFQQRHFAGEPEQA